MKDDKLTLVSDNFDFQLTSCEKVLGVHIDATIVCDVYCVFVTFSCGILGQVCYLIVLCPDPCRLSYANMDKSFSTCLKKRYCHTLAFVLDKIIHFFTTQSVILQFLY